MNRYLRRHPTHPSLLILYPSKKRIPDCKGAKPLTKPKKLYRTIRKK